MVYWVMIVWCFPEYEGVLVKFSGDFRLIWLVLDQDMMSLSGYSVALLLEDRYDDEHGEHEQ